jgi:hypothetical protein
LYAAVNIPEEESPTGHMMSKWADRTRRAVINPTEWATLKQRMKSRIREVESPAAPR